MSIEGECRADPLEAVGETELRWLDADDRRRVSHERANAVVGDEERVELLEHACWGVATEGDVHSLVCLVDLDLAVREFGFPTVAVEGRDLMGRENPRIEERRREDPLTESASRRRHEANLELPGELSSLSSQGVRNENAREPIATTERLSMAQAKREAIGGHSNHEGLSARHKARKPGVRVEASIHEKKPALVDRRQQLLCQRQLSRREGTDDRPRNNVCPCAHEQDRPELRKAGFPAASRSW